MALFTFTNKELNLLRKHKSFLKLYYPQQLIKMYLTKQEVRFKFCPNKVKIYLQSTINKKIICNSNSLVVCFKVFGVKCLVFFNNQLFKVK